MIMNNYQLFIQNSKIRIFRKIFYVGVLHQKYRIPLKKYIRNLNSNKDKKNGKKFKFFTKYFVIYN